MLQIVTKNKARSSFPSCIGLNFTIWLRWVNMCYNLHENCSPRNLTSWPPSLMSKYRDNNDLKSYTSMQMHDCEMRGPMKETFPFLLELNMDNGRTKYHNSWQLFMMWHNPNVGHLCTSGEWGVVFWPLGVLTSQWGCNNCENGQYHFWTYLVRNVNQFQILYIHMQLEILMKPFYNECKLFQTMYIHYVQFKIVFMNSFFSKECIM